MTKFYTAVRRFYILATEYLKKTYPYPIKDDVLFHAKFINFEKREECDFDSVEYFIHRFPHLQDLTIASEVVLSGGAPTQAGTSVLTM